MADAEMLRILAEAGPERVADLLTRMGSAITQVADEIEDGGDRCLFGSTNDADLLRDLRQEWFEFRWLAPSEFSQQRSS